MKYLQKLGKALMLPVACLPICGILIAIYGVLNLADLCKGYENPENKEGK